MSEDGKIQFMECLSHLVQLYTGFTLLLKGLNRGELTCQCDIITRSCDYFIDLVSSGCIYLFDIIIATSYMLLNFVTLCLMFELNSFEPHHIDDDY